MTSYCQLFAKASGSLWQISTVCRLLTGVRWSLFFLLIKYLQSYLLLCYYYYIITYLKYYFLTKSADFGQGFPIWRTKFANELSACAKNFYNKKFLKQKATTSDNFIFLQFGLHAISLASRLFQFNRQMFTIPLQFQNFGPQLGIAAVGLSYFLVQFCFYLGSLLLCQLKVLRLFVKLILQTFVSGFKITNGYVIPLSKNLNHCYKSHVCIFSLLPLGM